MLGIVLQDLGRRFGHREVVRNLTFTVEAGEVFGLLGPNGSGKSTTLKMLTTLLPPTSGDARIGPHSIGDVVAVRRCIGVVFQDPSLDLKLTVLENMDFFASLYQPRWSRTRRRDASLDLLRTVGLEDRAHDLARTLSWGMRRRLEIGRALLSEPQVLFLDEPTTGLDPQSKEALWERLLQLRRSSGLTVVLATHDMEEASRCDRVGILHEGRLVAVDRPVALCDAVGASHLTQAFLTLTTRREGEGRPPETTLLGRDATLYRRGG